MASSKEVTNFFAQANFAAMEIQFLKQLSRNVWGEETPPPSEECTHVSCYFGMDLHPCVELTRLRQVNKLKHYASLYGGTVTGRLSSKITGITTP